MDTREQFDRKCTALFVRMTIIMSALKTAFVEDAPEDDVRVLLRLRNDTIQESLDYIYGHWEYIDEPTQADWNSVAADLPLARSRENENSEPTDED